MNPITQRPIKIYGKQHIDLIKKNILKGKLIEPTVLTFKKDVNADVIDATKNAIPKRDGMFVSRFKNKIITKNKKITIEDVVEYIIDRYPALLENSLDEINDHDSDDDIKLKFSKILHKKLMT